MNLSTSKCNHEYILTEASIYINRNLALADEYLDCFGFSDSSDLQGFITATSVNRDGVFTLEVYALVEPWAIKRRSDSCGQSGDIFYANSSTLVYNHTSWSAAIRNRFNYIAFHGSGRLRIELGS